MSHPTPRVVRIGTEIACAVFANLEARRRLCHSDIDNALFVDNGLDSVRISLLIDGDGTAISVKRQHIRVKVGLIQCVRAPKWWLLAIWEEDLAVELTGGVDAARKGY